MSSMAAAHLGPVGCARDQEEVSHAGSLSGASRIQLKGLEGKQKRFPANGEKRLTLRTRMVRTLFFISKMGTEKQIRKRKAT
jgi:hypothetical protein